MANYNFHTNATITTQQMVMSGLMTALLCILAPFSVPLPISPVPLTFGTLAVYLAALLLGTKRSFFAVLLYLLLGCIGLPVFTAFTGGVGQLLGPTGGYLMGYLLIALSGGYFSDKYHKSIPMNIIGMLLGTFGCYVVGSLWLSHQSGISLAAALTLGVLPFLPGDALKLAIALLIGLPVKKRLSKAGII